MGSFRNMGRARSVLNHQSVSVPPVGEHPGVHVPGATAVGQRERLAHHPGRTLHPTHRHRALGLQLRKLANL